MTKREMFEKIATINADDAEIVEFCAHEIEILDNRKVNKKPSPKARENEGIMDTICNILSVADAPMTVTDLRKTEELSALSSQKVSALLRKLCLDGKVVKVIEKKVSFFKING